MITSNTLVAVIKELGLPAESEARAILIAMTGDPEALTGFEETMRSEAKIYGAIDIDTDPRFSGYGNLPNNS